MRLSNEVYEADECFMWGHTGEPIQVSTHRVCVGDPIGNMYGFHSVDITENGEWIVTDSLGQNETSCSNSHEALVPSHFRCPATFAQAHLSSAGASC